MPGTEWVLYRYQLSFLGSILTTQWVLIVLKRASAMNQEQPWEEETVTFLIYHKWENRLTFNDKLHAKMQGHLILTHTKH